MVALHILAKKQKQGAFEIMLPGIRHQFGSNKFIKKENKQTRNNIN